MDVDLTSLHPIHSFDSHVLHDHDVDGIAASSGAIEYVFVSFLKFLWPNGLYSETLNSLFTHALFSNDVPYFMQPEENPDVMGLLSMNWGYGKVIFYSCIFL